MSLPFSKDFIAKSTIVITMTVVTKNQIASFFVFAGAAVDVAMEIPFGELRFTRQVYAIIGRAIADPALAGPKN